MRRRGVGIAAVKNTAKTDNQFKAKGSELAEDQLNQLSKQLESFQANLQEFASQHKGDIKKNAEFRKHFQEMCATIGVDPLASSKGFWSEMLGVGDYYYELGVQIVEVAMSTTHRNGGIMSIEEMRQRVIRSRGQKSADVSMDDILQAIKRLKILGNGFTIIPSAKSFIIQAVPGELTQDHTTAIQHAKERGYITRADLTGTLGWDSHRAELTLDHLAREGLVWIDKQATPCQYWFPGFFAAQSME